MNRLDSPTVYVVDDEQDFVGAVSLLLRTETIPHIGFTDPRLFLESIRPETSGCILLDVRMPHLSGLEVQDELLRRGCHQPVLFLTGHGDIPMAVRATRAGAFDFLEKPVKDTVLLAAVRAALKEDRLLRQKQAARIDPGDRLTELTPRERQIAQMLVEGLTNTQMADRLALSVRTVEMHRLRLMRRLGVKNTAQAVHLLSAP